jgi:hypothetical protein
MTSCSKSTRCSQYLHHHHHTHRGWARRDSHVIDSFVHPPILHPTPCRCLLGLSVCSPRCGREMTLLQVGTCCDGPTCIHPHSAVDRATVHASVGGRVDHDGCRARTVAVYPPSSERKEGEFFQRQARLLTTGTLARTHARTHDSSLPRFASRRVVCRVVSCRVVSRWIGVALVRCVALHCVPVTSIVHRHFISRWFNMNKQSIFVATTPTAAKPAVSCLSLSLCSSCASSVGWPPPSEYSLWLGPRSPSAYSPGSSCYNVLKPHLHELMGQSEAIHAHALENHCRLPATACGFQAGATANRSPSAGIWLSHPTSHGHQQPA